MDKFLADDFLLESDFAVRLYQDYASDAPIFDYHCHLPPLDLVSNRQFANLSEIWLAGDHYKWRVMRATGVDEHFITGAATPWEKFCQWAKILPSLQGNPLYHWSHLELRRFFAVDDLLNSDSAAAIWQHCNQLLSQSDFSTCSLVRRSNVWALCTTDAPSDQLEAHTQLQQNFSCGVFPTFRPDVFLNITSSTFAAAVQQLAAVTQEAINSYYALIAALQKRIDYFDQHGCRLADHGLDQLEFLPSSAGEAAAIFSKVLTGSSITTAEYHKYRTHLLLTLAAAYYRKGWVMQLHMFAARNLNQHSFSLLGADSGFDAVNSAGAITELASLLDQLVQQGQLPKCIFYSLNPNDVAPLATLIGCFQQSSCPGYLQLGAAWWFNDCESGICQQLISLAERGCLATFIGMLTDSRSLLSYPRHEYFRRILCNVIGGWVQRGVAPGDLALQGKLVADICFNNAKNYIPIDWPAPC